MRKFRKQIKEMIIQMFSENPKISIEEIHEAIMKFVKGEEPLSDKEIKRESVQALEMVRNYVEAKRS